jgi:glycosyltransferase involved in cell wall biosynthesis
MKLGIVYHMPFWVTPAGDLVETEGSFARYVDSLAPYFDEVKVCAPVLRRPAGEGTKIRAANVTLAPLPDFAGPVQFYPRLWRMAPAFIRFVRDVDVINFRIPTPAAIFLYGIARWMRRPMFSLVVSDLAALLPSMPYRGAKRVLWRAYTAFEEANVQRIADHAPTFGNGAALAAKHSRPDRAVIETRTSTIEAEDIFIREDTCGGPRIRILTVSRLDPRKGLRVLPEVVERLVARGVDVVLDIVGPLAGSPGAAERAAIEADAIARSVSARVTCLGAVPLDQLLRRYRDYDLFVLPTLPGEGIPRVLLEAMASGVPLVTSRVSGIPGLVTHEGNGLLVDVPGAAPVADALWRLISDDGLRRRLISQGYETARAHTLQAQAARMMSVVSAQLNVVLRHPAPVPAAYAK